MSTKIVRRLITALFLFFLVAAAMAFGEDTVLSLKERIIDLQNNGALGFRNFTLCSNIITYGQYVPYPDNKVRAGSTIYFYYEPENVFTNRIGGVYQVWYTQDMIVQTASGAKLLNNSDALSFNFQSRAPVLDLYAENTLDLGNLPPGRYEFAAVLHDKLRKTDARISYPFEIVK
jgi:hypothetical protein